MTLPKGYKPPKKKQTKGKWKSSRGGGYGGGTKNNKKRRQRGVIGRNWQSFHTLEEEEKGDNRCGVIRQLAH
jgi:hypothetical protein